MQARVTISRGGAHERRRYLLHPGKPFILGRQEGATIVLDDPEVSRRHASLELRADGVYVTDLGSSNGTRLAGQAIEPEVPTRVDAAETLELGIHRVTVELVRKGSGGAEGEPAWKHLFPEDEFEILGPIGRGGKGIVLAARQRLLDRMVAIKLLETEMDPESEEYHRFLREAKLCARVKSPYVVQLYDFRLAGERPYFIMELVSGTAASERLEGGPLDIPEALRIGEDVARALEAAAQIGVIHRDVKPHNIFLAPDGTAKLGDFGIAKELGGTSFTKTGVGLGSLPYVAPEQARDAKAVDGRTDIYALGATLFHLIAGRPPFIPEKGDLLRTVERITQEEPPLLRHLRPACPEGIDAYIGRMLSKAPEERPFPAGQVAEQLRHLLVQNYPGTLKRDRKSETHAGLPRPGPRGRRGP